MACYPLHQITLAEAIARLEVRYRGVYRARAIVPVRDALADLLDELAPETLVDLQRGPSLHIEGLFFAEQRFGPIEWVGLVYPHRLLDRVVYPLPFVSSEPPTLRARTAAQ